MRTDSTALDDVTANAAIAAASSAIRRSANRDFNTQDSNATVRYFTPLRAPFGWRPFMMPNYTFNWYPLHVDYPIPDRFLPIDDVFLTNQLITDLVFKDHATQAVLTLDRLWPFNAPAFNMPYTAAMFGTDQQINGGEGSVDVTAKFGWVTVPQTIFNACLVQASRYVKRRESPLGVAGFAETGAVVRLLHRLDPDVEVMISDFRRPWAAA